MRNLYLSRFQQECHGPRCPRSRPSAASSSTARKYLRDRADAARQARGARRETNTARDVAGLIAARPQRDYEIADDARKPRAPPEAPRGT